MRFRPLAPALLLWVASPAPAGGVPEQAPRIRERGTPYMTHFTGRDYRSLYQNWAVVQDGSGLVYAGNNLGILEYDGVRWRLLRSPRGTAARALTVDGQGRILAAFPSDFGHLASDNQGTRHFQSLMEGLPPAERTFSEPRSILSTPWARYDITTERLHETREGRTRSWTSPSGFQAGFLLGHRICLVEQGKGPQVLQGDAWEPLPGTQALARERVVGVLDLGAAWLFVTEGGGLFHHDGQRLSPFPTEEQDRLRRGQVTCALRLADGSMVFGTRTEGLVHLDAEGRSLGGPTLAQGLPVTAIHALTQDAQGGLWMALGKGLCRVELPSPLSRFEENRGLLGAIFALHRHQDTLHVGTDQGVYRLVAPRPGQARFEAIPGLPGNAWAFLSRPEGLFVAAQDTVYLLAGGRVTRLYQAPSHIYTLAPHPDPTRIRLGLAQGLVVLRARGGAWEAEGPPTPPGVAVRSMVEEDGSLWLGTSSSGVLRLDSGRVRAYGEAEGLPSLKFTNVHRLSCGLRVSTEQGLYRYDAARDRFEPDPAFQRLFPEGPRWVYALREGPGGRIWMHSFDQARRQHASGAAVRGPDGTFRWDATAGLRFAGTWVETLHVDPDGTVWFGGREGLVRLEPWRPKPPREHFPVLIREVRAGQDRILFGGSPEGPRATPEVPFRESHFRFEFASPGFTPSGEPRYQSLLEGYEGAWTPWQTEPFRDFPKLPAGRYRFRVRGEAQPRHASFEASYTFRVLPPWYQTWWAWLIYLSAAGALLRALHRGRVAALRARNAQLEARIRMRTQDLEQRTRELDAAAAELRTLNDQKNHFLGLVAHDLRSPLNGIVLAAQLLEEETDPAEVAAMARRIQQEGIDMSALIGRFLDIAAIESGMVHAEPEPLDLTALARHILARHQARATQKRITLTLQGPDAAWVLADPRFTKEALDNLVSNALKFSGPDTCTRLTLEGDGARVRLAVQDQGPGLTPEDMARLFGKFARLSARPTGGEKSTGLGLSIVRSMVEAMGGRIWATSEPGQGATFFLELPAGPGGDRAAATPS